MKRSQLLPFHAAILSFLLLAIAQSDAVHRKCLEDKNCDDDECCAMAFYLFRCEKRGMKEGAACGLCGCANNLSCVSEGVSWRILSGRGVCRFPHRPSQSHQNCTKDTPTTSGPAHHITKHITAGPNPTVPVVFQNLLPNNRSPAHLFRGTKTKNPNS